MDTSTFDRSYLNAPHRYPAGVQVFSKIRGKNYLYVDKTSYIQRMLDEGGTYYFLSRPRRFGKTLLVSTLEAYFQGKHELFEGLAVDQFEHEWRPRPVIRLDLSGVKETTPETLRIKLGDVLEPIEVDFGITEHEGLLSTRVDRLIRTAAERDDRGAVVLIDEYDSPLLSVMHDPERLQIFRETMREFYSPLKMNESRLGFVFITGISKFSQLSIFSELNNLQNISLLPQYAGICGITGDEIDQQLGPDVAWLAKGMDIEPAECRELLRKRYDGYHFSEVSPDIYNPFSLVTAFNTGKLSDYWFSSGTPTALVNMLRSSGMLLPRLEGTKAMSSMFDAPTEGMDNPIAFMYQSGYLTIKGYDALSDTYTLGVPNDEVEKGLYSVLLPAYSGTTSFTTGSLVIELSDALRSGDMDTALHKLRSFFAGIPYDMAPKDEKDFQTIVYLILRILGIGISTEVRIATGRIDAVIDTPGTLFVTEFKYSRPNRRATAADSIGQIDEKGYLVPWEAGNKPVVKVGVVYSEEARTLDEDWIIEDA